MKPWEMDWSVPQQSESLKPWEMDWSVDDESKTATSSAIDIGEDIGRKLGSGVVGAAQNILEVQDQLSGMLPDWYAPQKYMLKAGPWAADKLSEITTGKPFTANLKEWKKSLMSGYSPEQRSADKKLWWDGEKGEFGEAWADWRSYTGPIAESAPEMLLTMGPSIKVGMGVYKAAMEAAVTKGMSTAAAKAAATAAAQKASMVTGLVSEGMLAGGASAGSVRDEIMDMKDDVLKQSTIMQQLMTDEDLTFEQAKKQLAEDSATQAFVVGSIFTGAFSWLGDKAIVGILTDGIQRNLAGRIGKGAVGEMLEETGQSGAQSVNENVAIKRADQRRAWNEGTLNQMIGGGIAGGIMGGTIGGFVRPAKEESSASSSGNNPPVDLPSWAEQEYSTAEIQNMIATRVRQIEGQTSRSDLDSQELELLRTASTEELAEAWGLKVRPDGKRDEARANVQPLNDDDRASPIPDDLILGGREAVADSSGSAQADKLLKDAGIPPIGSVIPFGGAEATIIDAFDGGAILQFSDGRKVSRTFAQIWADQAQGKSSQGANQGLLDSVLDQTQGKSIIDEIIGAVTPAETAPSRAPTPEERKAGEQAAYRNRINELRQKRDNASQPNASQAITGEVAAGLQQPADAAVPQAGAFANEQAIQPTQEATNDDAADIGASQNAPLAESANNPVTGDVGEKTVLGTQEGIAQIARVPVSSLKLSKDVPNFKAGANDSGVVEPLAGQYEETGTAPLIVWQRKNGDLEVVSGRHRLDLARRTGKTDLPVQVFKESDGYNKAWARQIDAEINIRDGQGEVRDYAKYFRGTGESRESAEAKGLLARAKGRDGFVIADSATDLLFESFQAEEISERAAAEISRKAPKNEALQAMAMQQLKAGKGLNTAVGMIEAVQAMQAAGRIKQSDQGDLFGMDDSAMQEAERMAKEANKIRNQIKNQINAAKGAANNPDAAKKLSVDVKNPDAVKKKLAELDAQAKRWEKWPTDRELREQLSGSLEATVEAAPEATQPKPQGVPKTQPQAEITPPAQQDPTLKPVQSSPKAEAKSEPPASTAKPRGDINQALLEGDISVQDYMDATGLTDDDIGMLRPDGVRGQADNAAKEGSPYLQVINDIRSALDKQADEARQARASTPRERKVRDERMSRIRGDRELLNALAAKFLHPFDNNYMSRLSPNLKVRFSKRFDGLVVGDKARDQYHEAARREMAKRLISLALQKQGEKAPPALDLSTQTESELAAADAKRKASEAQPDPKPSSPAPSVTPEQSPPLTYTASGKPFQTRKAADLSAKSRKGSFEVVEVDGGFALRAVQGGTLTIEGTKPAEQQSNVEIDNRSKFPKTMKFVKWALDKAKVTTDTAEYEGKTYTVTTRMFEGNIGAKALPIKNEMKSAGNAVTLVSKELHQLSIKVDGQYTSDRGKVRVVETVYVEQESAPKPEVTAIAETDTAIAAESKPEPKPDQQDGFPNEGLPILDTHEKPQGYRRVPYYLAEDAYQAVTREALMSGSKFYLHVRPAKNGKHGIARLVQDGLYAPSGWKMVSGEGLRLGFMTKEQALNKIADLLKNEPVVGTKEAAEAPTLELSTQTEEELAAADAKRKADEAKAKETERKQKVQAEASDFALTDPGMNQKQADLEAHGQGNLFDAPVEQTAPKQDKPKTGDALLDVDLDELSAMIDQTMSEAAETHKPEKQRAKKASTGKPRKTRSKNEGAKSDFTKSASESLASAGVKLSDAGLEGLKGLSELFSPKNTLNSGLVFTEESYQRAKPHFKKMWAAFQAAGKALKDFVKAILDLFGTGAKPFIMRFAADYQADKPRFSLKRSPSSTGLAQSEAQSIVDEVTAGWNNAPKINVVQSVDQLPDAIYQHAEDVGALGDVRAVYWRGVMYFVAERFDSRRALEKAVLHEAIGHFGLRSLLGDALTPYLERVYLAMARTDKALEIKSQYFGKDRPFDASNRNHRLELAEELIAHLGESGKHRNLWNKIVSFIQDVLRKMKFSIELNEKDLLDILRKAEAVVKDGGISRADGAPAMSRTLPETIEVDGVQRPTLNSEGRPIHPTEEGIRNFWRWFGDSRVTDDQGRPLVVYHGTNADFTEFDPAMAGETTDSGWYGKGLYFTPNTNWTFAEDAADSTGEGAANVMPVYLSIKDPYYAIAGEHGDLTGSSADRGRDGVIVRYEHDHEKAFQIAEIVALRPNQIKSSIGNTGQFSPDTDDIRFRRDTQPSPNDWAERNRRLREEDKSAWEKARNGVKRWATAKGNMPDEIFREKVLNRDTAFKVTEFDTKHLVAQLEKAVRKAYGKSPLTMTEREWRPINQALQGAMNPNMPDYLREAIYAMRQYIDLMSAEYMDILMRKIQSSQVQASQADALRIDLSDTIAELNDLVDNSGDQDLLDARDAVKGALKAQKAIKKAMKGATRQDRKQLQRDYAKAKMLHQKAKDAYRKAMPLSIRSVYDNIRELRSQIAQSQAAAVQAENQKGLYDTIANNMGSYLHRSYRAFDDPKWFSKIPDETINAARMYLVRGYMEQGDSMKEALEQAERAIHSITKSETAYDSMGAFISESKLGAKDLSVLMRRKMIADPIKKLLGEYDDPRLNFAKSATKMGRLIANTRFMDRVREMGLGVYFFEEGSQPPEATVRFAAEGSKTLEPLNGLYTFPEINQAFHDAMGNDRWPDWMEWIVTVNGTVKYGKTVLSPTTAARNWMSAAFFAMANANFSTKHMAHAWKSFKEQVMNNAGQVDLAYMRKLIKLGVVYDSIHAEEMMALLRDSKIQPFLADSKWQAAVKVGATLESANNFAQGFYSFGDDFWKIIGFESEKAKLIGAGMTEAEAEVEAAERIRNTYPTYSMVGKAAKFLRKFPVTGTFVSFPAEIIRTTGHMFQYAFNDILNPNPKMQKIGWQRLASMGMVASMFWGASYITKLMFQVDDEEEEAIRLLAPPWAKNSTYLYIGRDKDGRLIYVDLTFLDPYSYWKRPVTAFLSDQSTEEALATSLSDLFKPFFGTDIMAGAIMDIYKNKKETGTPVYKEGDSWINQQQDKLNHLRKAVQPGIVTQTERTIRSAAGERKPGTGQPYEIQDEAAAWFGWRVSRLDPKAAVYYRAFEFGDAKVEAMQEYSRVVRSPNEYTREEVLNAKRRAEAKHEKAYEDMEKIASAAVKVGLTKQDVRSALIANGVSSADATHIINGRVPRFKVDPDAVRRWAKHARVMMGEDTAAKIMERYRESR